MEPQEHKLNVVLKLPNIEVFLVEGDKIQPLVKGTMSLLELPEYESYIISVGDFGYNLSKEIPVMAKKLLNGETIYILPNVQGHYGMKVPADAKPQLVDVFESILDNTGELLIEFEEPPVQPVKESETKIGTSGFVIKKSADYDPNKAKELAKPTVIKSEEEYRPQVTKEKTKTKESGSNDNMQVVKANNGETVSTSTKVSNVVVKSGEVVRDGLVMAATITATGISKAGSYLINRFMKKSEDVEVKEATLNKIKLAKTATNAFAVFTAAQIKAILSGAGMIVKELGNQWENSKDGQAMKEKRAYQTAKKIGKSALEAGATVYDGMYQALVVLGRGVSKTTTEALTHKYGQQLGTATQGVCDAIGNVGLAYKAIPMETAKALATKDNGTNMFAPKK